jgi:Putative transmembrane protein (PGPGW)
VLGNLKRQWRAFRSGKPGHRFQDRFDRNRRARASQSWLRRLLQPAIAIVLILIGVVLTFIPGPAIVFYFAGAGILAGESRTLARALDWSELKVRKVLPWLKDFWAQASPDAKQAVILAAFFAIIGAGYVAYRVILAE